jgi:hypothetical protein
MDAVRPASNQFLCGTLNQMPARRERFMHENDGRIVETAIEARGARLGRPVLVVLLVSTLVLNGVFALIYYGSFR